MAVMHYKRENGVRAPCGVRYGTKAKFTIQPISVSCPKCRAHLAAQVDTRPKGGDAKQGPFTGSAVGEADAPKGDQ